MALTPEQTQLLQTYMMKNRVVPQGQPAQQIQLPEQQSSGNVMGGLSNLLSSIGGNFDVAPEQGPVQPGAAPLPQGQQSWLSRFADRIDPVAAQQRQILAQQQSAPKIDMKQVMAALAKAGIR